MAAESNRCHKDLHAAAGNAIHVLSPHAPRGTTLADHLRTMPPWIIEVATHYTRLGATSAMAVALLRLGEDLTVVELGFSREMSSRHRQNLIDEFSAVGDGVLTTVDVEDIIHNTPRE